MSTSDHVCAWCNPGAPGNHGICARHQREVLREFAREFENDPRWELPLARWREYVEAQAERIMNKRKAERLDRVYGAQWWRSPVGAKRGDQLAFSLAVLAGCAAAGVVVALWVAAKAGGVL